jgi:hypothetical protein
MTGSNAMKPVAIKISPCGTRFPKLKAQVRRLEPGPTEGSFEVVIGGEKWKQLPDDLRERILDKARQYLGNLNDQVAAATIELFVVAGGDTS